MTRDKFVKYKFMAYMGITVTTKRTGESIECLLVSVDFDKEVFELMPLDHTQYEQVNFFASIDVCELTRGMRITKRSKK